MMNSHIAIFSSTTITFAIRMKSNTINGSKMTFYSSEFLFKYEMEKSWIKLANSCGCRCYIHCILTSSQDNLKDIKIVVFENINLKFSLLKVAKLFDLFLIIGQLLPILQCHTLLRSIAVAFLAKIEGRNKSHNFSLGLPSQSHWDVDDKAINLLLLIEF